MSSVVINGSNLGTALSQILICSDIQPGEETSYQSCKLIYEYHPLGAKMASSPISMAQSQQREIAVPTAPDMVAEAWREQFKAMGVSSIILNLYTLARVYGVASVGVVAEGITPDKEMTPEQFVKEQIAFNVWDPLNTAGSLVLNQNPNAIDFLKHDGIAVSGTAYHRSRTFTVMNEKPIYLGYTNSAFGYVGRSVYQRALYPLRTYLKTMIADDMVATKVGVIVAKLTAAGSVVTEAMQAMFGVKRNVIKEAQTWNVINIGVDEFIESLDLKNLAEPLTLARKDALENCAIASDMPAKLLNQETFAEGFGEGTEDAKHIIRYVDRMREEMNPAYAWFDRIVMYRAWNPDFFKVVKEQFPEEYEDVDYKQAFYSWANAFKAEWPSLLTEPESEKIKVEETKFNAAIKACETILPLLDPGNKVRTIEWLVSAFNEQSMLFKDSLDLEYDDLLDFLEEAKNLGDEEDTAEEENPTQEKAPKPPTARADAEPPASVKALVAASKARKGKRNDSADHSRPSAP